MRTIEPANIAVPEKFLPLFQPARYKIYRGGRGGAKSWNFARALLAIAATRKVRVLCAREYQSSIADSVHRLLTDQIYAMGLGACYKVQQRTITSSIGSEFIFKGLRHSIQEIKSTEGVDICWVEEAQSVSNDSWEILIPTIRKEGSEIWVSFNPEAETDPTYQRFVAHPPPNTVSAKVGWQDNPWFPPTLEKERLYMLGLDLEAYEHVWNGNCKQVSEAVIFAKRTRIDAFETPDDARFFHGADWGFANDPSALVRCFVQDERLFIDAEAFGYGVELDDLPVLFAGGTASDGTKFLGIPTARTWPIHADSARPETISYMRRQGFNIDPAEKWPNCVEDGIQHLKGFKEIVIHARCKHMQEERRLYSYKTDRVTGEVLPLIIDRWNHGWDAIRYSLDGYITSRGGLGIWAQLAG